MTSPNPPLPGSNSRGSFIVFLVCFALHLFHATVGWRNSIREIHESRQVQTALSAQHLQADGWKLSYPLPVFGPPWSAPFEFPLYQQVVATTANIAGLPLEQAGRLVAMLAFYLALPAVWLAQAWLPIPRGRRWLGLAAMLVVPCHIYYSRAFMIESTALFCGAWFLACVGAASEPRRGRVAWIAGAVALGAVAAMVKFPTFLVFAAAAGALALARSGWPGRERNLRALAGPALVVGSVLLVAAVAGIAWTRYADAVKASNPLAAGFVSAELKSFVFGSAGLRFTAHYWNDLSRNIGTAVMPAANIVLVIVLGVLLARQRSGAIAVLLAIFAVGPLVFANLYAVHDYYFYACAGFAAVALALTWSNVLDEIQYPAAARWAVVGFSIALQLAPYRAHYLPAQRSNPPGAPEIAEVLRAATAPEDVVVVFGQDWNPTLSYYSGRRSLMVVDRFFADEWRLEQVLGRLPATAVGALVVSGELRHKPDTTRALAARLQLFTQPALVGAETVVFLPTQRADELAERVQKVTLRTLALADVSSDDVAMPRQRVPFEKLADPRITRNLSPAPDEIIHPFGAAAHEVDGVTLTDAHAPTDIVFTVPSGARSVKIGFGLLAGAYRQERPTDGVEFRVELVPAQGRKRTVFARELRPTEERKDRGTMSATFELPADAAGKLVFRTLPGPSGSIASDWAYWSEIAIK